MSPVNLLYNFWQAAMLPFSHAAMPPPRASSQPTIATGKQPS